MNNQQWLKSGGIGVEILLRGTSKRLKRIARAKAAVHKLISAKIILRLPGTARLV